MPAQSDYYCPVHETPLAISPAGFRCESCNKDFSVRPDGIALLDVVQLEEASDFDEKHREYDVMSDAEIGASSELAARFLSLAGLEGKARPRILDVACGKGELTVGLLLRAPNADVYAFDHSILSLEALVRTAERIEKRDRVKISAQDATALFYEKRSFDLISGNAVLHHFLEWRDFISSCRSFLADGGSIVLAEPFADGYIVPMIAFLTAARELGITDCDLGEPDMGFYAYIRRDIGERIRGRNNPEVLSKLTDKHLFVVEDFTALAKKLDLTIDFENYEHPLYYEKLLDDLLKTYSITNPAFTEKSRQIYAELREFFGGEYASLFSHFKFVSMRAR